MIRSLICTDVETGCLDPTTDPCIEVACVVFDIPSRSVISSFSSLIAAESNATIDINRIPVAALSASRAPGAVWNRVGAIIGDAQRVGESAFVAHRAEFDRSFYPKDLAGKLPWICSKFDIEWPLSKLGEGLVNVALAHGVAVTSAHRALTDATLIARLFERTAELGHDLDTMIARATLPRVVIEVADRSFSATRNAAAKAAGFFFHEPDKSWRRRIIAQELEAGLIPDDDGELISETGQMLHKDFPFFIRRVVREEVAA